MRKKMKEENINGEWAGIVIVSIMIALVLLFSGCTSFKKIKQKYGNRTVEIEQIPYQKTIGPDTATLHIKFDELIPSVPVQVKSHRSGITLTADESGNITAKGFSDPIYIYDSIPYPVEKTVFKEADLDRYILKTDAIKERKIAVEMATLEGQIKQKKAANGLGFFDKVKNTAKDIGLGIGFCLFILLIVLFLAARVSGKFMIVMAMLAMSGCARADYSKPFVVEGIYYNAGACYYELSQVNKRGNKRYFRIQEQAGAKQLLDTVYLVEPGTLIYTENE